MKEIKNVFDLVEKVISSSPIHVSINEEKVNELANKMKEDGKVKFYTEDNKEYQTGIYIEIIKELVACSINFCYWYGKHDIRPNNNSSTSMYNYVDNCFNEAKNSHALNFENRILDLIDILSWARFPLLEERKRNLLELCEGRKAEEFAKLIWRKKYSENRLFFELIKRFQGFASDMFLKRASLFFIQLHRKYGWYENLMQKLFVPADYQLPKILHFFDCIEYSTDLSLKISENILIHKHSLEELQIRASTIKACKILQDITKWNASDIDTYLWTKRKESNHPFHLTYTTDY